MCSLFTFDGFCNEDLRVGCPYLCSFPAISDLSDRCGLNEIDDSVRMQVWEIMEKYCVRIKAVGYMGRISMFNPEPCHTPTILIAVKREKLDDKWLEAAREVRAYLVNEGLPKVSFEIFDPECFKRPYMSPVLKTDLLFDKWDAVLRDIIREVNKPGIETIGCYRRGRSSEERDNPPTVLVTVNSKSKGRWNHTRDTIVNILDRHGLPMVAVEIMKDEIRRASKSTYFEGSRRLRLAKEILQGPAMLGESIAPHSAKTTFGSLGAFIEPQFEDGGWREFALTCFRCVYFEEDDGIEPRDPNGKCFHVFQY